MLHKDKTGMRIFESKVTAQVLHLLQNRIEQKFLDWASPLGWKQQLVPAIVDGLVHREARALELSSSADTSDSASSDHGILAESSSSGENGSGHESPAREVLVLTTKGAQMLRRIPNLKRYPHAGEVVCDDETLSLVEGGIFESASRASLDDMRADTNYYGAYMRALLAAGLPVHAIAAFEVALASSELPSPSMVETLAYACAALGTHSPVLMAA